LHADGDWMQCALDVAAEPTVKRGVVVSAIVAAPGLAKAAFEDELVVFEDATHGVIVDACCGLNAMERGILAEEQRNEPGNGGATDATAAAFLCDAQIEEDTSSVCVLEVQDSHHADGRLIFLDPE